MVLWGMFVLSMVILVINFVSKFPGAIDVDITDPLSILEDADIGEEKRDICVVCDRKKGSEPLLICQNEKCINKSEND